MQRVDGLPGAEIVTAGLRDLDAGRETVAALLVAVPAIDPASFRRAVADALKTGG